MEKPIPPIKVLWAMPDPKAFESSICPKCGKAIMRAGHVRTCRGPDKGLKSDGHDK